jgi:acyl-CoA reductase-like NAD-dependent aldehyde dehydrogenase
MGGGFYYQPTIFAGVDSSGYAHRPGGDLRPGGQCIMKANSLDHAIEIANSTEYGLSFGIYTQDLAQAFSAVKRLKTGVVNVNSPTMGVEIGVPFRRLQVQRQRGARVRLCGGGGVLPGEIGDDRLLRPAPPHRGQRVPDH